MPPPRTARCTWTSPPRRCWSRVPTAGAPPSTTSSVRAEHDRTATPAPPREGRAFAFPAHANALFDLGEQQVTTARRGPDPRAAPPGSGDPVRSASYGGARVAGGCVVVRRAGRGTRTTRGAQAVRRVRGLPTGRVHRPRLRPRPPALVVGDGYREQLHELRRLPPGARGHAEPPAAPRPRCAGGFVERLPLGAGVLRAHRSPPEDRRGGLVEPQPGGLLRARRLRRGGQSGRHADHLRGFGHRARLRLEADQPRPGVALGFHPLPAAPAAARPLAGPPPRAHPANRAPADGAPAGRRPPRRCTGETHSA